jgi:hypothetical protein
LTPGALINFLPTNHTDQISAFDPRIPTGAGRNKTHQIPNFPKPNDDWVGFTGFDNEDPPEKAWSVADYMAVIGILPTIIPLRRNHGLPPTGSLDDPNIKAILAFNHPVIFEISKAWTYSKLNVKGVSLHTTNNVFQVKTKIAHWSTTVNATLKDKISNPVKNCPQDSIVSPTLTAIGLQHDQSMAKRTFLGLRQLDPRIQTKRDVLLQHLSWI